ncbi:MAG: hypothetical protein PUG02_05945, partial [Selenomonadaceae bacterium]|nr:hypothetical protein [Selenomonadaceae bacterium]
TPVASIVCVLASANGMLQSKAAASMAAAIRLAIFKRVTSFLYFGGPAKLYVWPLCFILPQLQQLPLGSF